jgi:hypothetical protein
MPKTVIEKSPSPSSDVTVFSVSGTLGFHEKDTLEKLFDECNKRSITHVVLDISKLSSLGGGCAKIIQAVAAAGEIALGITGAKATVLKFLKNAEQLVVADSIEEAVSRLSGVEPVPAALQPAAAAAPDQPAAAASQPDQPAPTDASPASDSSDDGVIILGLEPLAEEKKAAAEPASQKPDPPPARKKRAGG